MRRYLYLHALDWVLCLLITMALAQTVCSGFELPGGLPGLSALMFGSGLLLAVFVLLGYQRLLILLGSAAGLVLLVNGALFIRAYQPFRDETANGMFVFLLILFLTALLVYLLSRTRVGSIVLGLMGCVLCAGASFLEFPIPIWCLILHVFSASVLVLYRIYRASVEASDLGAGRLGAYSVQTILLCLTGLLMAAGLFLGVVRPLSPPTMELKLITVLKSMDMLEVLGVARTEIIFTEELVSDAEPEQTEYTNEPESPEDDSNAPDEEWTPPEEPPEAAPSEALTIRYDFPKFNPLWLLLWFPLMIATSYGGRILWKRRWHSRLQALPREEAVLRYYRFFLSRLDRLGVKRTETHTLREFTADHAHQLQPFALDGLTEIYERVLYGGGSVSEAEYNLFEAAYAGFYRTLRRELGTPKYYLTAFRY